MKIDMDRIRNWREMNTGARWAGHDDFFQARPTVNFVNWPELSACYDAGGRQVECLQVLA